QTVNRFERNLAISTGAVKPTAQFLLGVRGQLLATHGLTGFRPTDLEAYIGAGCLAKVRIKADDAVYFGTRHLDAAGDKRYGRFRNVSQGILHVMQDGLEASFLTFVALQGLLGDLQHRLWRGRGLVRQRVHEIPR